MSEGRAGASAALHAPFRPVRGRRSALIANCAQAVVFVLVAVFTPQDSPLGLHIYDRVLFLLVSVAIGALLWRFMQLAAFPADDGLTVRNLSGPHLLSWAQIVNVRFGGGQPWVSLDLDDGETLAVMAIQRADGDRAGEEARRLATLVALHSRTPRDD